MTTKTQSEIAFEKYCALKNIGFSRIEPSTLRTPDYELMLTSQTVIAEVKEIELDVEEEQERQRLLTERGYSQVISRTPGEKVRQKISHGYKQLRARSAGMIPTMLVLYDSGRFFDHLDPYSIRVAMYGLEQVKIVLPPLSSKESPRSAGVSYGPRRKMTQNSNTSISAVAALYVPSPGELALCVFHNRFARVPLPPSLLSEYEIRQFQLGEERSGKTAEWVSID